MKQKTPDLTDIYFSLLWKFGNFLSLFYFSSRFSDFVRNFSHYLSMRHNKFCLKKNAQTFFVHNLSAQTTDLNHFQFIIFDLVDVTAHEIFFFFLCLSSMSLCIRSTTMLSTYETHMNTFFDNVNFVLLSVYYCCFLFHVLFCTRCRQFTIENLYAVETTEQIR